MSNKVHKNKHNITKISAHSEPEHTTDKPVVAAPSHKTTTPPAKTKTKTKVPKSVTNEKPLREVFILVRPFVALGRYLRDSWREIRQVRWPNRKATWKMTLAVLIYCAIFFAFILLLDTFFTFIFNLLLGINK